MTQITICLVLFVAMLVLFFTNKLPMSFTALGAMILLVFTGCLDAKTAVATFGSSTVVTMAAMFVVAAGLSRTQMINHITRLLYKITDGSFTKVLEGVTNGYIIGFVFYMVSFLMTSLLYNRAVSTVLTPVAVITCTSIGCDPRGPVILCALATMSSLITPMATAVVPMAMDAGGYSAKTMFKVGILPGILRGVVGTLIAMTLFPM